MDVYFKAIDFATKAHKGQYRKGSSMPYLIHPLSVMQLLIKAGCEPEVVIAGCLHDVVEDTPFTLEDIRMEFGAKVADLVFSVSEPDKKLSWFERKKHTIEAMKKTKDKEILYLCCADKIHNIQSTIDGYDELGNQIWERFKATREQHEWYHKSLAEIFLAFDEDDKMFQEFAHLTAKLF